MCSWRSSTPFLTANISACNTIRPTPSWPATTRSQLLRAVAGRVVSMHASDRYLAEGTTPGRPAPDRRHARLFAEPAARRHRQGPQRLRRHLPHPGRPRLPGLGQHRGRHERHGRDGRVAGVPAAHEPRSIFRRRDVQRVRTALVGCGKVGQIHADALTGVPEAEFVAVCDSDAGAGRGLRGAVRRPALHRRRRSARGVRRRGGAHRHAAPAARRAGDPGGGGRRPRPGREAAGRQPRGLRRHAGGGATRPASSSASISQRRFYEPVRRMKAAIDAGKIGRPVLGAFLMLAGATRPITAPTPGAANGTPRAAACWSTSRRTSSTFCTGSWGRSRKSAATGPTSITRPSRWTTRPWP